MKTIYLLRHAKSSWKAEGAEDIDRPLSKRGRKAAAAMADYLAAQAIAPAQILCSPARRTRQTLERMEEKLDAAIPVRYEKAIYMAEAPALLHRLHRLSDDLPSVMVIGHNPGMERLALMLASDGVQEARDKLAAKYPTGALAVLTSEIEHWRDLAPDSARLAAFVRPKDLAGD